ncbi:class II fructose-bisphosphate aldolase [Diplocloster agilis]|uniref:class II fructose-bisphosphate aldolase n=1 Tax=Diplocloster agilis TaxID=2850323 RepID=UPI000821094D|nr:class II fructose-bisphosphate aldolase [Suonthocola fibrivorans]MCU6735852.1 class II fructose-bisphosphate aldolase [Suonthocola fibrivorans]SCJ83159.1 Fructose-bisphosphate aldolase [uncultured Clostridium sp.]
MRENPLLKARKEHYAIGAFNVNTFDEMVAIADAAAQVKLPVMLMASMSSAKFFTPSVFADLVHTLDRSYPIDIIAHLDHCTDPELLLTCAREGFDSVMYDGSHTPYQDNVRVTGELAAQCHSLGVLIEGELGIIAGEEGPVKSKFSEFTDPDCAGDFIEKTGIDSLAVSIGNQHGFYKGEPKLQFELLEELCGICTAPLVLHGGTGIPGSDIARAIRMGICKVNVGTEIRAAYARGILDYAGQHADDADVRKFVTYLRSRIQETAGRYMECFLGKEDIQ